MNNNYLAALLAFFFWGHATVDEEDRTNHSSWMRTLTFLVLTIAVGLLYLKTLEVPMMSNYVDVRADRYTVRNDTLGEHVSLCFNNVMDDDNINSFAEDGMVEALGFKSKDYDIYRTKWSKWSGIEFSFETNDDSTYNIINKRVSIDSFGSKPIVNTDSGESADCYTYPSFISTFNIDSLRTLLYNSFDIRYVIVSKFQSMHVLYPLLFVNSQGQINNTSDGAAMKTKWYHFPSKKALSGWFNRDVDSLLMRRGVISFEGFSLNHEKMEGYVLGNYYYFDGSNHLGFFTAGDISQSNYQLLVHSDCPIDEIRVAFNTPVEMQHLPFEVDKISPYGFTITSPDLIDKVKDCDIRFFLKFPAMANKQLVRSLILTTLLTALVSMFLANLYYCLRRIIKNNNRGESKPDKRLRRATYCHNAVVLFLLAMVLLYAISVYNDWIIILPYSFWIWGLVIAICFVFIILGIEYALYRYAHLDKSDKHTI